VSDGERLVHRRGRAIAERDEDSGEILKGTIDCFVESNFFVTTMTAGNHRPILPKDLFVAFAEFRSGDVQFGLVLL